jgi:hypothetical protein
MLDDVSFGPRTDMVKLGLLDLPRELHGKSPTHSTAFSEASMWLVLALTPLLKGQAFLEHFIKSLLAR